MAGQGRRIAIAVAVATLGLVGVTSAGAAAKEAPDPIAGVWVGPVEGSDAYVAVVVGKHDDDGNAAAGVYLCNSAELTEWFFGSTDESTFDVPGEEGGTASATVTKARATGTIDLADGTTLDFTAKRAKKPAGLYRATAEGGDVTGGWIILADGTQHGAVIKRNTGDAPAVTLDPANPTVTVNGTTLNATRVRPWTDPDPDPWTDPSPDP
jgi:hypothetical protein